MKKFELFITKVITAKDDFRPLIPRITVGLVFLSEGIQKFLLPEIVGVGRFEKLVSKMQSSWPILLPLSK